MWILGCRTVSKGEDVQKEIEQNGGVAIVQQMDLKSLSSVKNAAKEVLEKIRGRDVAPLGVLVLTAGIFPLAGISHMPRIQSVKRRFR